jgi:hypothetical protein
MGKSSGANCGADIEFVEVHPGHRGLYQNGVWPLGARSGFLHAIPSGPGAVGSTRHRLPSNTALDHDRGAHGTLPVDRFAGRWFRGSGLTPEGERFRRKFAQWRESNVLEQSHGTCHNLLTWLLEPAVR